jgi:aspartate/methionine/tyrosine aminotransferase
VRLLHAKPVFYPLHIADGWQPRAAELDALVTPKTKLLLVNTPSNPTGSVLSLPVLEELWGFCKRHDLFCLSDEIYSEIVFNAAAPAPSMLQCAGAADDPRLLVAGGVAKSHAMTGFRVGWLRGSPEAIEVAAKLQEPFLSCGVPFAQAAAEAVLRDPATSASGVGVDAYRSRRDLAMQILAEYGLDEYVPDGAFYLLVNVGGDSEKFAAELLQNAGVAVAPGAAFGGRAASHVRVAFCSSEADIEAGVRAICEAVVHAREGA